MEHSDIVNILDQTTGEHSQIYQVNLHWPEFQSGDARPPGS